MINVSQIKGEKKFMEWITNNFPWIIAVLAVIIVALIVALVILDKRDKKITADFQDKVLTVESEQMEENIVPAVETKKEEVSSPAAKPVAKTTTAKKPAAKTVAKKAEVKQAVKEEKS